MGKIEVKVTFRVLSDMFPSSCSRTWFSAMRTCGSRNGDKEGQSGLGGQGWGMPSNEQDQPLGVPLFVQRHQKQGSSPSELQEELKTRKVETVTEEGT